VIELAFTPHHPIFFEKLREKHGIDFDETQVLLIDENCLEIPARTQVIGKIMDKFWSAVITYCDKNIRIISVRRSRGGDGTL
jgi:uncharacterized DUF497 family protein